MKKVLKAVAIYLCIFAVLWCGGLILDRQRLNNGLIRLHVVAASDSETDQAIKLQVRDAVVDSLRSAMSKITDREQAKVYLQENLQKIEAVANQTLAESGCEDRASVSLAQEAFDTRYYDTFTLPAGVYEALRITIGEGKGKNWWCVVFPTLCLPATSEGFGDVAAGAGFTDTLTAALEGKDGYEIRFWLLDVLGRMENSIFPG